MEVKDEIKEEVKDEIKEEVKDEIKEEVKDEIKETTKKSKKEIEVVVLTPLFYRNKRFEVGETIKLKESEIKELDNLVKVVDK